jgi:hypothetical protein
MKNLMVGLVAVAGLLGACAADATDFKEAAEKPIKEALGEGASADCDEPADTKVGTAFTCTGTDAAGSVTNFVAEITAKDKVTVTQSEARPGAEAPVEGDAEEQIDDAENEVEEQIDNVEEEVDEQLGS